MHTPRICLENNDQRHMSSEEPTLRQMATVIWQVWSLEARAAREAIEAEQRRRLESFRAELRKIIGDRDDINIRINGGCVEAEVEDICFVAFEFSAPGTQEQLTLVTLLGRCPSCGAEAMSEPFYNLAGLGKMLERFAPISNHLCYYDLLNKPDISDKGRGR